MYLPWEKVQIVCTCIGIDMHDFYVYTIWQVAFFFCGLAMMAIALLLAVQGSRKSGKIFNVDTVPHSPLHITAARADVTVDSGNNPERFSLQTLDTGASGTTADSAGTDD